MRKRRTFVRRFLRCIFHQHILVRVVGLEPTRLAAQEPKGDVTLVKDFKNPKYLQSSAPSHPLSTLPLNAGR